MDLQKWKWLSMERVIIELFGAAENGFDPSAEPKPGFQLTGDDSS